MLSVPLLLAAAAIAGAPAPGGTDLAGNALEPLTAPPATGPDKAATGPLCSADHRWCATIDTAGPALVVQAGAPGRHGEGRFTLPAAGDDQSYTLWPNIVLYGPEAASKGVTIIVGVQSERRTMYSGGEAATSELTLYRFVFDGAKDPDIREVLSTPISGSKMIRACFSQRDDDRRRGACHDQYDFDGALALDPTTRAGPPEFTFTTLATSFPGRRTLDSDSTTQPPLRQSDLKTVRDPVCSYRRAIRFDPARQLYAFDQPPPACSDYLDL